MEATSLLLLLVLGYAVYAFLRKRYAYFEELGLPYVPGVPVLGNMAPITFRKKHIIDVVRDIYNYMPEAKYIGAFDFLRPVLVLRDPELIKNVTIKNFDNFPDHHTFVDDTVDPLFGANLFQMAGDRWKEARNLLSPSFTSSKMKAMFDLMSECAANLTNYISEQARDPNNCIAVKDLFTKYTNDVVAICAFGVTVDSLKDPNNRFYELGKEATNFEGLLSVKFALTRAFPKFCKMLRIRIVASHVAKFFTDIVRQTVELRDQKGVSRPDMLQLMMDARGKTSENLKLDITQMTAQVFIFFFGGFDTTSTQMCIIAHELILNPDVQERLQAEIDEVMTECNGKPTYEAINGMPYFEAVFQESMRRHPQANVIDRLCTKSFELPPALPGGKPFVVQPGMNIWVPVAAIHVDENIHEDPYKFDPERYLNKKVTINQVENLGFGIGPRSCIGNRFAILETKILFFYLLSKFTLKPSHKTAKNFEYSNSSLSIVPKGGYWMTVVPRN